MKKLLSLLLVLVMIVSVTAVSLTDSVAATGTRLFLDEEFDAQINSTDDRLYYSFCAPYDGIFEFYSSSDFDLFVTVTDQNGDVVATDDNSGGMGDFKATVYMNKGDVYTFEVKAFDVFYDGRFSVFIKESQNTVTQLEVVHLPYKTEYEYGTIVYDIDYSGLKLKATMLNSSTYEWSYDDGDKDINGVPLKFDVDYDASPVVVNVSCGVAKTSFELGVLPSDISSIELVDTQPLYLYENSGGYFDYENDYYHYRYDVPTFDVLVTFDDGTQELTDTTKEVRGASFEFCDDQFIKHFALGENKAYVKLKDKKAQYSVFVHTSPVVDCVVNKAPTKQYELEDDSYISYNEYTDEYTLFDLDLSGIEFTLKFNDGTQKTYTDADIDMQNGTIDCEKYYVSHRKINGAGEYYVYFSFKGYEIGYTVFVNDGALLGDADGDNVVSVLDATQIQLHLVGAIQLDSKHFTLSDADKDGDVSVLDATQIQLYLCGIIDSL